MPVPQEFELISTDGSFNPSILWDSRPGCPTRVYIIAVTGRMPVPQEFELGFYKKLAVETAATKP
jgi:hypothetical protein